MSNLKILWVHDNFDGPNNGLAEWNDKKVWFRKAAAETAANRCIGKVADDQYELVELDEHTIHTLEDNHQKYCAATGRPLLHGDPIPKKEVTQVTKAKLPEDTEIHGEVRSMVKIVKYSHNYDPNDITGTVLATVSSSDFINFFVPHRLL